MTDRAQKVAAITARLGQLSDEQLDLVDRASSDLDHTRRYGNPGFILGFGMLSMEGDEVNASARITQAHLNPHGIAHGMIGFGFMDNALGQIAATTSGTLRPCVASELHVNFVRPMFPGEITIEARAIHAGRRQCVSAGEIKNAEGKLCLRATGTYVYMDGKVDS